MADDLVRATLAAAIVVARQATSVEHIQTAWLDAEHIIRPKPTDGAYKAWQVANGLQPTTPEQDAEKSRRVAEGMAELTRRLTR